MNNNKKLVSIVVPIYNEVDMIHEIYDRVNNVFNELPDYDYELVFFDDGSSDGTCKKIEDLSEIHPNVKGVFYSKNFGYIKNTFYAVQQAKGDCAFLLHADLQNPPELIPEFLKKWENGAQVVLGIKNKSKENKFMYFLRSVFYFIIIHIFGVEIEAHATEFELFDKSFVEILRGIKISKPFLRKIIIDYSSNIDRVYYTQNKRKKGKSKFNLNKYYDFALCGIIQYSTRIPRKLILLNIIGLLSMAIEFLFILLPELKIMTAIEISNSLLIRLILAGIMVTGIVLAFIIEYAIFIVGNCGEMPMIVERKRINY